MNIDIGNMKTMLSIVNSIIGTKPACRLSKSEKQYLSVLVIKVQDLIFFVCLSSGGYMFKVPMHSLKYKFLLIPQT